MTTGRGFKFTRGGQDGVETWSRPPTASQLLTSTCQVDQMGNYANNDEEDQKLMRMRKKEGIIRGGGHPPAELRSPCNWSYFCL